MRLRTLLIALACSIPMIGFSPADEFKLFELKNGTKYSDVPIIEETDTHYIVSVPEAPGKSIKVEKKFAKSEVKQAVRPTPEEVDFKKVSRFFVSEEEATEQSIADFKFQTDRFLKKHPESPNKAQIDELQAKYDVITKHWDAGDIKFEGKWITKEQQQRILYTIRSQKLLDLMKSRAQARDYRNALNCYEKLLNEYPAAEATATAEKSVVQVATLYEQQIKAQLAAVKAADAERQKRWTAMAKTNSAERGKEMQDFRNKQSEANKEYQDRVKKERDAGIKRWLPVNTNLASAMESSAYNVASFIAVKKREVENKKESDKPFEGKGDSAIAKYWEAVDQKDVNAAKDWMGNIRGYRVPEDIRRPMEDALKTLQDEKRAAEAAARAAQADARRKEAEKRAAERAAEREKSKKAREETAKKIAERKSGGKEAKESDAEKPAEEPKAEEAPKS